MISVILPIYNVERYLEKCLRSVLTNTYRDLEIICVNDGSTDSCPEILARMREEDHRIRIISHENRGLPEARNSGLAAASGEYVSFIDSDDWVHPRYFQALLDCMEATGADMALCGCRRFAEAEDPEADPSPDLKYRKLGAKEFYRAYFARHMVWGRMFRRKDLNGLSFPRAVDRCQDTLFNLRFVSSLEHPNVYAVDAELYYYLQRPGSLIRSRPYGSLLQIGAWYVRDERSPRFSRTGEWGWMPLLHSISMTLSGLYESRLHGDKATERQARELLRAMIRELLRDKRLSAKDKAPYLAMYGSPALYRRFRLMKDPTMRNYERDVRAGQ